MRRPSFATPLEWLYLVVGWVLVWRYAWLLDDAFIYFRYVDNWVLLGRGLVYNSGEYVEGFTSPLWVLTLALLRRTELDYWTLVRGASLIFWLGFWVLGVQVHRWLNRARLTINMPLALMSAHYGVLSYFSSGLETPLVQLSAAAFAALAVAPRCRTLALVAGLAPVVRPDLLLPWAVYVVGLSWMRQPSARYLLGSGLIATLGWECFRIYYYADLLPNTFYLKDDTNFAQGARYLYNSLRPVFSWVLLVGLALALAELGRRPREAWCSAHTPARLLMVSAACSSLMYVWRSGGDMLYYRFIAFALPLLLFAAGGWLERWLERRPMFDHPALGIALAFGLLGISLAGYPRQLKAHPLTFAAEARDTMSKVDGISDASWHRHHPDLRFQEGRREQDRQLRLRYQLARSAGTAQGPLAIDGWCVRLFFDFDHYAVHWWGLTQPFLAHADVPTERPGHKYQLVALAKELGPLYRDSKARRVGGVEDAIDTGRAPDWVVRNLEPISVLERRMYNHHDFIENLTLALTPLPPIVTR